MTVVDTQAVRELSDSVNQIRWALVVLGTVMVMTAGLLVVMLRMLWDARGIAQLAYTEAKMARAQGGITERAVERTAASVKDEVCQSIQTLTGSVPISGPGFSPLSPLVAPPRPSGYGSSSPTNTDEDIA